MKLDSPGLRFAIGSKAFLGISAFQYKKSTDAIGSTNTTLITDRIDACSKLKSCS